MGIIGSIRKHSGWAVAVVALAIVAFIIGDLTKNQRGIPDLGKVAGQTITRQAWDARYAEAEQQYLMNTGMTALPNGMDHQLRQQVWQTLVSEVVMGQAMDKLGISVSAEELTDMYIGQFVHPQLRSMFSDQSGRYMQQEVAATLQNFDNLDSTAKVQWSQLEKFLKQSRAESKYRAIVANGFYMPKAMAKKMAEWSATSNDVRVACATFQSVSDDEVKLEDSDYQNYYKEHKADFRTREELRAVDYIAFPVIPTQEDMTKIAEEVNTIWDSLQVTSNDEMAFFIGSVSDAAYDSTYRLASEFKAQGIDSILAKTATGSFIAPQLMGNRWVMGKVMAAEMRPDSLHASVMIILNNKAGGNVTRNEAQAKSLTDSVYALIKANKLQFDSAIALYSDMKENNDQGMLPDGAFGVLNEEIIKTPVNGVFTYEMPNKVGHYIVKVLGKGQLDKRYRVALVTRNILPSNATQKAVFANATQFAAQNRTHSEMIAAAQEQGLMMRSDMLAAMSPSLNGLQNGRDIVRWAFDEKTAINTVADQVYNVSDNNGDVCVVVALKDVYKKGYATLDQVRNDIEGMVRMEKKAQILMEKASQIKSNNIDDIAAKLGTTVDTVLNVNFADPYFGQFGMEPRVQSAAAAAKVGKIAGPVKGARGVYMIQVDNQTKVAEGEEQINAQAQMIGQQYQQMYGQKMNALLNTLIDKAKVEDNRILHF